MKLRNAPAQASNTCRLLLAAASPHAPTGKLHRSLGLRALMIEGFLSREQGAWFGRLLAADAAITRIIEVGFNAGHSSCAFLAAREDVTVVSFDLGLHGYVTRAKQYIDKAFPGRHTLVIGDSRETLPRYRADHPAAVFDLAFVDGGHDYDVARADLVTILPMIRPSGLIVRRTWSYFSSITSAKVSSVCQPMPRLARIALTPSRGLEILKRADEC